MKLKIKRHWYTNKSSIGNFFINETMHCFSLEDVARAPGVKIPKETAIPAGEYEVIIDFSQRFQKRMSHILDVPGFDGVRFHGGNRPEDTEGCPILGYQKWSDMIWDHKASDDFYKRLEEVLNLGEKVTLEITDEQL